ncbi:MAG: hypothetical protein LBS35_12070 [Synergistaceae bacterium]|nr:hypothetical protein [Synergistaceae bacterium]
MEVAGTGAFFVPVPGLTLADSFDGFESKERNIQVIVANFGAPLDEIVKGFTEETFKAMGMELKSKGEFTVNGARAVLFKVLHPRIDMNWGKWIMLTENGENTLEANAVFVSGDTDAASDLEAMLKGVYVEPPRPVSVSRDAPPAGGISEGPVSGYPTSEDVRAGEASLQPDAQSQDILVPSRATSQAVRSESETEPASRETDSTKPDGNVPEDLAKTAGESEDMSRDKAAASNDIPVSRGNGDGAVSSDKPVRKAGTRIITEKGVVTVEDGTTGAPEGANGSGE